MDISVKKEMQGLSLFHIVFLKVEVFQEIVQIVHRCVFLEVFVVFMKELEEHSFRYLNYVLKRFDQKLQWKNLVPWLREVEPENR